MPHALISHNIWRFDNQESKTLTNRVKSDNHTWHMSEACHIWWMWHITKQITDDCQSSMPQRVFAHSWVCLNVCVCLNVSVSECVSNHRHTKGVFAVMCVSEWVCLNECVWMCVQSWQQLLQQASLLLNLYLSIALCIYSTCPLWFSKVHAHDSQFRDNFHLRIQSLSENTQLKTPTRQEGKHRTTDYRSKTRHTFEKKQGFKGNKDRHKETRLQTQ